MNKRLLLVASALLVLATSVLVSALLEPPHHVPEPTAPLTDMAGATPEVLIHPEERPDRRLAQRALARSPGHAAEGAPEEKGPRMPPAARGVPPSLMPDPSHPPQWTRPLAVPTTPSPPDPFVPPSLVVDPERGRHSQAE